jgi:hypothetical protein
MVSRPIFSDAGKLMFLSPHIHKLDQNPNSVTNTKVRGRKEE